MGVGSGLGREGQREKIGTTVIDINNKIFKLKMLVMAINMGVLAQENWDIP